MENLSPKEFIKEFKSKYGEMALDTASVLLAKVVRDGKISNDEEDEVINKFISKYGEMAYYDMINFLDEMVLSDKMAFSDVIDFLDEMAFNNKQQDEIITKYSFEEMPFNDKQQDEILIKCSLEEMVKAFFKDYEIIWHDPNVKSQENQLHMAQLEKLCKVQVFTEWKKADDYIKTAKTVCHVITSGTNGKLFVKEIFSSQNVPNILTFCRDKDHHSIWAKNYQKTLCIETKIEDVILQIQKNLTKWHKQTSSLKFDLPAFAPIFDDSDKSQMNYLHFYLKVIPNFNDRIKAKEDVITLSKEIYSDKKNEKLIADFEQVYNEYNKEAILKWYTQQSFLYKIVNNCLRIATSDSIQWSRFLLKDIERAIKDQYQTKSKKFSGLLYRAAYLSEKEWLSLKENVNREIEMHGFLSVSKEKRVAERFMGVDAAQKVLITIIVPKGPFEEEQGFAEIEEFSEFPKEKEVLFNVRSRFTVLETEDEYSKDLPYRHLVLFYGAQGFRKYISEENPVYQVSIEDIEWIMCSCCQVSTSEMSGQFFFMSFIDIEKQSFFCRECLAGKDAPFLCVPLTKKISTTIEIKGCLLMNSSQTQVLFYGYECSKCGVKDQKRYFVCTSCGVKEKRWCQSCFETPLSCIEAGHALILENYPFSFWCEKMSEDELIHLEFQTKLVKSTTQVFQQAEMYVGSHEYEKANEYYNLYIEQIEATSKDGGNLAVAYNNIGSIYVKQGEYKKAREYFLKSLDIGKLIYEENHLVISTNYNCIGLVYHHQGEYSKALEYYFKSLDIEKFTSGENHPDIATSYNNIGSVYDSQGELNKALEYYFKCLDIKKSVYGENHPSIATSYNNIGTLYFNEGEYEKALEHFFKSLDIDKSVYGENHPDIATSYNNIGSVYDKQGEYNKAIEYYFKCLDIKKSVCGENHPSIATSYNNIGTVYVNHGEYEKALEHFFRSLDVGKSVYRENHPFIATLYNNIGIIYDNQGEYNKAIEYYFKSLDISKSVYGENHPEIAASFYNIGSVYINQEEYNKAFEYFFKSLGIWNTVYKENHPEIAHCYNKIGSVYRQQGEYSKAIEYYFKSRDIYQLVFRENHPLIANFYQNIGLVYEKQGDDKKALESQLKCLEIYKSLYRESHPDIATPYNNIGSIYRHQGEHNKALEYFFKSLDIRKSVFRENHLLIADLYQNIGLVYENQTDDKKALEYYLKCLDIHKLVHGENHSKTATIHDKIHKITKASQIAESNQ